ncbi:MAG: M50 family metallopeptidase [Candidatus Palauibacterales bacterium]|jgi:Peptidase M50B-like|nr:M50 family metallopeptidase [Candidatus Palauibacterales bacterium]MDP2483235.1 M50 family metallopeptidase [Candidatus Palauibacterales bacterium]
MAEKRRRAKVESATKSRARFIAGFTAFFVALWFLWNTWLVLPLKLFVVLLHEISHGLAAVATGGAIDRIVITPDLGGACYCGGGDAFLTLSAGYLGSLLWGSVLVLLAARLERRSPWITGAIGVFIGLVAVLYVRNPFGLLFGLSFGAALVAAARYLSPAVNRRLLWTLGLTSCLYAVLDIKSDVLDRPELRSDARMLAEMTGVPTLVWGGLWILAALFVCWLLFRRIFRQA